MLAPHRNNCISPSLIKTMFLRLPSSLICSVKFLKPSELQEKYDYFNLKS